MTVAVVVHASTGLPALMGPLLLQIHHMVQPGNGWVDCGTSRHHPYVRMLMKGGDVHHQTVRVETIATERAGSVAACVAPLFSHRPDISDWMYHYSQLGVSKFHMYWATVHTHDHDATEEPLEVWRTVDSFHFRVEETHTDPFYPFDHPLAIWHHYSPSNREIYFGQAIAYNDCIMRTRYTHDYALQFDVDEYLAINATALGRTGKVLLPEYLEEAFPKQTASLEFMSWQVCVYPFLLSVLHAAMQAS